jgi:hypothetical protein
MKNKIIIGIIVAVIVAIGAFFGGMKYGQAKTARANTNGGMRQFGMGQGQRTGMGFGGGQAGARGGGLIAGEILSKDDKSVTVKLMDGGSKIVFLSASTTISKFSQGAVTDLEVGNSISVQGKTNSDGTVTAQLIQLRPAGMFQAQTPR